LVARAQPTVPLYRFRLDITTQNKIIVQFHNYYLELRTTLQEVAVSEDLNAI